ncbi:MAG: sensor histidine kinase [Candidatus Limnocylindrales bacterium]
MSDDETRRDDRGNGGWLIARPVPLLLVLDAAGVGLAAATVAQLADPDILLHIVWIVLALQAFTFGLRPAALRIGAASVFVVLYAAAANDGSGSLGATLTDLDLEEWPLMAVIAVLVAIMAERVTSTGRRYAALYRAASNRLLTAQEDERRRLALDLHDGVGQTITALTLTLDAAEASLVTAGVPDAGGRDGVRRAREISATALEEVRGVALRLRPPRLDETGLVAAIQELSAAAGVPVAFAADPALVQPGLIDRAGEVEAYRVVQEALGNAARHARATRIAISIRRVDRHLRIEVTDDGVGFNAALVQRRGLGLASMRDRAAAVHGTLVIRSKPGVGTVVRLDVPLANGAVGSATGDTPGLPGAELPARA